MIPLPTSTSYLLSLFVQLAAGGDPVGPEVEEPLPSAGGLPGAGGLIVVGLGLAALYIAATVWWPFVSCPWPKCEGGKRRSPTRKAWRKCWWCRGSGSRIRWGRRLYEAVTGKRTHTAKRGS